MFVFFTFMCVSFNSLFTRRTCTGTSKNGDAGKSVWSTLLRSLIGLLRKDPSLSTKNKEIGWITCVKHQGK